MRPALISRTISETMPPTRVSSVASGSGRSPLCCGAAGLEDLDEALHRGAVAGRDLAAGGDRLDHAEAGQLGLGGEEAQHRRQRRPHLLRPLAEGLGGGPHRGADVVGDHLVGGEETGFLVGEVLVEGAAGDRGGLGDVGDRGRVVAALGDRVDQRRDDPLALVLLDELARQAVAAGGQAR